LRDELPDGGHVVAIRGNVTYVQLAMQDASAEVRSIVCDGADQPPATWEGLGMETRARATEANLRLDANVQQGLSDNFQGADEAVMIRLRDRIARDGRLAYLDQFVAQTLTLNLLEELRPLPTPTLYLRRETPHPGWSEPEHFELFLRFLPNTEFGEIENWRYHEPSCGKVFAEKAIAFMKEHSGRTILSTVLFADIVDSTVQAATMGDRRWSQVLGQFHSMAAHELQKAGGKLVDTAGDGFLAVFDNPSAAVDCAKKVVEGVRGLGLEARAGVHSGQVEVSGEKYSGVAVHTAARVATQSAPGEVIVSETVRRLLSGSTMKFEDRGAQELKGIAEPVQLYAASD
jgi:class 3 adenylate cyclase